MWFNTYFTLRKTRKMFTIETERGVFRISFEQTPINSNLKWWCYRTIRRMQVFFILYAHLTIYLVIKYLKLINQFELQ